MKKTLAAFAVLGALAAAPAAFAAEPDPVPAVAEAAFVAPAPEAVSAEQIAETHEVADERQTAETAAGMGEGDGMTVLAIVILVGGLAALVSVF